VEAAQRRAAARLSLVGVPAAELALGSPAEATLLVCGCDARSRGRAVALGRRLLAAGAAPPGLVIHGARSLEQARRSFEAVAAALEHAAGAAIPSYGLLVDDLALYRSLVERRPVGLARPQSPAARALADVATLLAGDLGLA
jgi:hypothetical protein